MVEMENQKIVAQAFNESIPKILDEKIDQFLFD